VTEMQKRRSVAELLAEGGRVAADLALGGDSDDELQGKLDAFNAWLEETGDKALACKVVIRSLESEAVRFRDAEKQIAEKRRQIEDHIEALRFRTLSLAEAMLQGTGKKSVDLADGGKLTVTERETLDVQVTNPMELPEGCGEYRFVPDKAAIKAAYKANGTVPGANVTVSASKSLTVK